MDLSLRPVVDADLPLFFAFNRQPAGVRMAAFTPPDPDDREAFDAHWARIRARETVLLRTVEVDGVVVGSVLSWESDDGPEISYWVDESHWGRGIATEALRQFLLVQTRRPLRARVVTDNLGSIRVLRKNGFVEQAVERGFAHGRGREVEEYVMVLA